MHVSRFPLRLLPHDRLTIAVLVVVFFVILAIGSLRSREAVDYVQAESQTAGFRVDPNTASQPELILLPGIGEKLADGIIASRAEKPFRSTEDLRRVRGIGPVKCQTIRPYLRMKNEQ